MTSRIITLSSAAFIVLVGLGAAERTAAAQPIEKGSFGLGIIIGEPTGISAKLYLDDDTAVAAAAGSAFIGGGLQVHADYLLHPWVLENRELFVLPAYVGGGARLLSHDTGTAQDLHIGARAVGGILFDFKELPLDAFFEVAAVLDFAFSNDDHGGFGIDLNAGLGTRYYF